MPSIASTVSHFRVLFIKVYRKNFIVKSFKGIYVPSGVSVYSSIRACLPAWLCLFTVYLTKTLSQVFHFKCFFFLDLVFRLYIYVDHSICLNEFALLTYVFVYMTRTLRPKPNYIYIYKILYEQNLYLSLLISIFIHTHISNYNFINRANNYY